MLLFLLALIPVAVSFLFVLLNKKTPFKTIPYIAKQIIYGVSFGGLAILFTEVGPEMNGAILNIRDSAPVCAGLLFGSPAGIIAGLIGGLYRYFCVYWGGGTFTQVACSVATVVAGLASAGARKFMFYNKRPNALFASGIAMGAEVIHMLLILLTNISQISKAMNFVIDCSLLMIGANAVAVFLSDLVVAGKDIKLGLKKPLPLLTSVSISVLVSILSLMVVTGTLTYVVNHRVAQNEAANLISVNLNDIENSIEKDGLNENVTKWRVGQSGGVIVYDNSGTLLSAYKNGELITLSDSTVFFDGKQTENTFYTSKINGENIYYEYTAVDNYYVFAFMTVIEADMSSDATLYMMLYVEILIYLTIFCLIYQTVRGKITKKLHKVNNCLDEITQGNLDTVVDVRTCLEYSELSDDINHTVDTLKEHIKEAENRNERELELARRIQKSAVPFIFPPFPKRDDFDIFASMNTAKEVGGDFYDFYFTDDVHFAFLIADVSGKGIPAAMFMMAAKTLIKGLAERGKTVDEVFTEANASLCEGNDADMFLTAWIGVVNLETGHMAYTNAGHNPPLLCRKGETFEYVKDKPNFILAGMNGVKYKKHELNLDPGDTIYLYTDGVTEAENEEHKLYGEERLKTILLDAREKSPKEICTIVGEDVKEFVGEAPQSDDITMVAFKMNYMKSTNSITVRPDLASVDIISTFIDEKLSKLNIPATITSKVQIAVDEIFSNIQKYGKATRAKISFGFNDGKLALTFTDNGLAFDPTQASTPDVTLSVKERQIGGLGIYLVKKLASSVTYEYKDNTNNLYIIFDLTNEGAKK